MKLSIILIFLFMYSTAIFSQDPFENNKQDNLPEKGICAHRGANETHPENTLAAFEEAIRLGAQMIEFDVQLTKDNQLVIMHDDKVNRTTNGRGYVSNLTLDKIKKFDAGKWKSRKFKGERVPTLKEALDIMPRNIWLNIHLKGDERLGAATAEAVIAANRTHQSVIACENEAAKGVKSVNTNLMICNMERLKTRSDYIDGTIKKGFSFLQIKSSRDDKNFLTDLKKLKEKGIKVNYFHSEETTEIKKLLEAGVDFILTDHLVDILNAFSKAN